MSGLYAFSSSPRSRLSWSQQRHEVDTVTGLIYFTDKETEVPRNWLVRGSAVSDSWAWIWALRLCLQSQCSSPLDEPLSFREAGQRRERVMLWKKENEVQHRLAWPHKCCWALRTQGWMRQARVSLATLHVNGKEDSRKRAVCILTRKLCVLHIAYKIYWESK